METFSESIAHQLIKLSIESGALKLMGPGGGTDTSAARAKMDAVYLLQLFESLTKETPAD